MTYSSGMERNSVKPLTYIGADLIQQAIDGSNRKRSYLDSAATSLPIEQVQSVINAFLPFHGSFHSEGHLSATLSLDAFEWTKEQILRHLGADPSVYEVVFIGAGATAAINRLAAGLASCRADRDVVVVSSMEHHSNDLPHRQHASHVRHIRADKTSGWQLDLGHLEELLRKEGHRMQYVAVTAASNVTGLVNPIGEVTRMAHAHGVMVLVDGAQVYAHHPFSMKPERGGETDFFVFSGHKAHAPGAPGVIVARKTLLAAMPPMFFGGGMVDAVSKFDFTVSDCMAKREHAGTPNVLGAFSLGLATRLLASENIDAIAMREWALKQRFITGASRNGRLRIYGVGDASSHSLGIVSFNLEGVPFHQLGTILNDHFCMAVRTGCFCAHPYVRELLFDDFVRLPSDANAADHTGMVRMSLGPHNTQEDIDGLLVALDEIGANPTAFKQRHEGGPRTIHAQGHRQYFEQFLHEHLPPPAGQAPAGDGGQTNTVVRCENVE